MSRNKLLNQKNILNNLSNPPPLVSELNSSSLLKLFIIGAVIGALLGTLVSKFIFGGDISDAYAAIISAIISGLCTIIGAIIQKGGRN